MLGEEAGILWAHDVEEEIAKLHESTKVESAAECSGSLAKASCAVVLAFRVLCREVL